MSENKAVIDAIKSIPQLSQLCNKVFVEREKEYFVLHVPEDKEEIWQKHSGEVREALRGKIDPNAEIFIVPIDENDIRFSKKRAVYTFSNFIVSQTNRTAFSVMKQLSDAPIEVPVVIFGPPAVGKTHLLKALHYAVKRKGERTIILLNMEKIIKDIFFHMKNGTYDKYVDDLHKFDYVLIDDLQKVIELSGKALTKIDWELFSLYEDFFEKDNKQLVFTCDRTPLALHGLSDRVKTRLFSGHAYEIEPPDDTIKRVMIERIVKENKIDIPDKLKDFIVAKSRNLRNVQELTSLAIDRYSVTGDMEYVLQRLSIAAEVANKGKMLITPQKVIESVCALTGVNNKSLFKRIQSERTKSVLQVIVYLLIEHLNMTPKEVAEVLGKSRPSVYLYYKQAKANILDDYDFSGQLREIENIIFGENKRK